MSKTLDQLFLSADNHAEDTGEPDHAVGDLQDMLRLAWHIMPTSLKLQFLRQPDLEDLLELGARDEFSAKTLTSDLEAAVADMEKQIQAAGYEVGEADGWFCWEHAETGEAGEDYYERIDAVVSAFEDLQRRNRG